MLKAIEQRKSVRKYLTKELTKEQLDLLVLAGSKAPSAHNRQPWEFIVVTERELLLKFTEFHKYAQMLKEAPAAIVVLGNKEICNKEEFIYCDCSAVTQNILLQAEHMGLGSCWCALAPDEQRSQGTSKLFNLPEHILPVALIAVGYEDGEKSVVPKPLDNKVFYNKYK